MPGSRSPTSPVPYRRAADQSRPSLDDSARWPGADVSRSPVAGPAAGRAHAVAWVPTGARDRGSPGTARSRWRRDRDPLAVGDATTAALAVHLCPADSRCAPADRPDRAADDDALCRAAAPTVGSSTRLDNVFRCEDLTVHPHVFPVPLSRREVVEYQLGPARCAVNCSGSRTTVRDGASVPLTAASHPHRATTPAFADVGCHSCRVTIGDITVKSSTPDSVPPADRSAAAGDGTHAARAPRRRSPRAQRVIEDRPGSAREASPAPERPGQPTGRRSSGRAAGQRLCRLLMTSNMHVGT